MAVDDICENTEIIELKESKKEVILALYNKTNPNNPVPYVNSQIRRMSERCPVCPYMLTINDEHYCIREQPDIVA